LKQHQATRSENGKPIPGVTTVSKLRVYLMGNLDGTHSGLVAAKNQAEAAKLFNTSLRDLRMEGREVKDEPDLIKTATSRPGIVFRRKVLQRGPWFVRGEAPPKEMPSSRPWRAFAGAVFSGGERSTEGTRVANFCTNGVSDEVAGLNAELAAKAVNLFDELVETLRSAHSFLHFADEDGDSPGVQELLNQIESLLRRAKEEVPAGNA
jgi:hypothetical protein